MKQDNVSWIKSSNFLKIQFLQWRIPLVASYYLLYNYVQTLKHTIQLNFLMVFRFYKS